MGFSAIIFFASLKMEFGTPRDPGPGFMPLLSSVLLFSLSLVVLITGINPPVRNEDKRSLVGWENLKAPAVLVIALLGYTSLLEIFGYLAATFLLMFIMFFMDEPKRWFTSIAMAFVLTSLSFFVFYKLLGVPLPVGIFKIMR